MTANEHTLPALYMVHREGLSRPPSRPLAPDVTVMALPDARRDAARPIVELDGALTDAQWGRFTGSLYPDGLFVAVDVPSGRWIGTCSAVDNPTGARFHFPGGGELGFLVVEEASRRRGVGRALVDAVVKRLLTVGCRHVWLGVKGWRHPAIRTYLRAGFVPLLHPPDPDLLEARWRRIFELMREGPPPSEWLRTLPP